MKKLSIVACVLISNLSVPVIAETEVLDYIVAVVNDDVIVNSTLQQELRLILEQWRKKTDRLPPQKDFEKQVLERLIMTALQLQLAKRTGIQVEDSSLNERLREMALKKHQDLQSFRQSIEKEGYSYENMRERIREQLILDRLHLRQVVSRISVTEREIDNFLANQIQQGTINHEYHLWHILIATQDAPSPEDIEASKQKANLVIKKIKQGADWHEMALQFSGSSQAAEGGDLGWRKSGEMPTLFNGVVNNMAVGEIKGPIRNSSGFHIIKLVDKRGNEQSIITQTKVRHILIKTNELVSDLEAKARLEELKFRIEQGDDFVPLARANSEDTTSAANGGLLGWVNPGDVVPEFEKVMSNLSENQVSKPFKSRYGWHLVQVLEYRKHDNTAQALRTQAKQQIRQRKIEEELESWLRQLRDEAYVKYQHNNNTF
ncbi:MAG: molecular chaperone SurA [Gammaproteobacteria bacterium]|nr:MAG: molecular chaperone SurA [Gammaproteobacteria bacterium]RKZ74514.1 MAG: molecular chaperone SurA [Gammaproteobacteria bacterium]